MMYCQWWGEGMRMARRRLLFSLFRRFIVKKKKENKRNICLPPPRTPAALICVFKKMTKRSGMESPAGV